MIQKGSEKKLKKIRAEIEKLRRGPANVRHKQLARLANKLGRKRDDSKGNEPTFVNDKECWKPLSIPAQRGKSLKKGTVLKILDILEDDCLNLEEYSSEREEDGDENNV